MMTPALVIAAMVALGALFVVLPVAMNAYYRFRGRHVVRCPENHETALVDVDDRGVALTAVFGEAKVRIGACSRWPEHADCGRDCRQQVEEEPETTRFRAVLDHWYEGKECFLCHRSFEQIEWWERPPAVMSADGRTHDFRDLSGDTVVEILETGRPVCRNCHLAETFRRICPIPHGQSAGLH